MQCILLVFAILPVVLCQNYTSNYTKSICIKNIRRNCGAFYDTGTHVYGSENFTTLSNFIGTDSFADSIEDYILKCKAVIIDGSKLVYSWLGEIHLDILEKYITIDTENWFFASFSEDTIYKWINVMIGCSRIYKGNHLQYPICRLKNEIFQVFFIKMKNPDKTKIKQYADAEVIFNYDGKSAVCGSSNSIKVKYFSFRIYYVSELVIVGSEDLYIITGDISLCNSELNDGSYFKKKKKRKKRKGNSPEKIAKEKAKEEAVNNIKPEIDVHKGFESCTEDDKNDQDCSDWPSTSECKDAKDATSDCWYGCDVDSKEWSNMQVCLEQKFVQRGEVNKIIDKINANTKIANDNTKKVNDFIVNITNRVDEKASKDEVRRMVNESQKEINSKLIGIQNRFNNKINNVIDITNNVSKKLGLLAGYFNQHVSNYMTFKAKQEEINRRQGESIASNRGEISFNRMLILRIFETLHKEEIKSIVRRVNSYKVFVFILAEKLVNKEVASIILKGFAHEYFDNCYEKSYFDKKIVENEKKVRLLISINKEAISNISKINITKGSRDEYIELEKEIRGIKHEFRLDNNLFKVDFEKSLKVIKKENTDVSKFLGQNQQEIELLETSQGTLRKNFESAAKEADLLFIIFGVILLIFFACIILVICKGRKS